MARLSGWRSVQARAVAVVLVVGALLGASWFAARTATTSMEQLAAATATARLQASAAQAVFLALQDGETGQRGYLLTGRVSYLEPYYGAITRIDDLLAVLQRRSEGVPWLEESGARLTEAAHAKMEELHRTVMLAQRAGPQAALAEVLTDAGKTYMDDARAESTRIIDRAEAERAALTTTLLGRQVMLAGLLLAGGCVAAVSLGSTALGLLWGGHRLRQARLREAQDASRLAAAIEQVPDGVGVFDAGGTLVLANARFGPALQLPAALGLLGASFEAIAGAVVLDPPVLAGEAEAVSVATEARHGARTLEVWRSPMPGGGQMLAVADVTRRVGAEAVARQSQKMDVLGQMTGGVAHDFNNLLQVVSANLELVRAKIERSGIDDPALLARLDAASAGVTRGARLTRHLLAFARKQPLAPEPIDGGRLLSGMDDVLRRTLGEAVSLELVIAGGLWTLRADPTQLENAVLNLTLNARDAMTDEDGIASGKLTIEARNATLDESYAARATDMTPGQYVMFAVTDSGIGMTNEQLTRAVEPFFTTKPEGRGTGLGLPMVLGFAKQSGGHFQLYSEPGQGTTARLYIPRTFAAADAAEPVPAQAPGGSGELVLVVEDDDGVRGVARDALQGLGYAVVEADSADAAVALLERGCRPRVVFTDVVMPGEMSARNLAARARSLVPGVAVLFTSGYTQNGIVHNGQLDADVVLLSKPWRTEDLATALRSVLAGREGRPVARRRVLIVEDEEMVRLATADALAAMGFDVIETGTAAGALARLQPAPDLLLTDLGLPDRDGLLLVQEVLRRVPGLPVVVASGQGVSPSAGVVWLPKPFDVDELRRAVEVAMAG